MQVREFAGIRKVCLFGGTFDPIHAGHVAIARSALDFCGAGKLFFLPSASPPHKASGFSHPMESFEHRLRMAEIAASSDARFAVSGREGRRSGPSFTVDTLAEARAEMPEGAEIFFLIGADWVLGLHAWKDIDRIFALCRFIVAPRPGFPKSGVKAAAASLGEKRAAELENAFLDAPETGISSTEIRERLASGLSVAEMLPPGVEEYLRANGLYGAPARG